METYFTFRKHLFGRLRNDIGMGELAADAGVALLGKAVVDLAILMGEGHFMMDAFLEALFGLDLNVQV
jgi:hypothetical protein